LLLLIIIINPMFGIYRTILALLVVAFHLLKLPIIGYYSVHGFFILSGYLMTYIMQHTYSYSFKGIKRFISNRLLRLYPIYWAVLLISTAILFYIGDNSLSYHSKLYLPHGLTEIIQNLTFIYWDFFPTKASPRISPTSWALTIEIFFYILIGLGISRSKKNVIIWCVLSIVYFAYTHFQNLGFTYRYHNIISGSLTFSIGAITYFWKNELSNLLRKISITQLIIIAIANIAITYLSRKIGLSIIENFCFYLNYLIHMSIIILLMDIKTSKRLKKIDIFIGRFSYPIYLIHWQIGLLITFSIYNSSVIGLHKKGLIVFFATILLTIIVSYFLIKLIEEPIDKVRKKIKST